MRNLGLIPKASDVLYSFIPEELNEHFLSIAISSTEDPADPINSILTVYLIITGEISMVSNVSFL